MAHPRDRSTRIRRRRFCITFFGSGGVAGRTPPETFITAADCLRWNTVILLGNEAEHCEVLTFFVVQTEKASNNRVHYQGYCEFKKAVEWSTVKLIFGERIHLEASRGTSAQNIRYCTKNDTRFTGGEICINGQWGSARVKGGVMIAAIKILNGAKLSEVVDEHPDLALLHMSRLESFVAFAKGTRTEVPKIVILFGTTGCGKSQYCVKTFPEAYWPNSPEGGRVW